MTLLDAMRGLSMMAWAVPMILFAGSIKRWLVGPMRRRDLTRSAVWFTAAVIVGFGLRWLVFAAPIVVGSEYAMWAGLYLLSAIAGGMLTYAALYDD